MKTTAVLDNATVIHMKKEGEMLQNLTSNYVSYAQLHIRHISFHLFKKLQKHTTKVHKHIPYSSKLHHRKMTVHRNQKITKC